MYEILFGEFGDLVPWLVGGAVVALVLIVVAMVGVRRSLKSDVDRPGMWGIVGRMGSGKTYLQTHMAQHARASGRPVFANFDVDGATRIESWSEVLEVPAGSMSDGSMGALVLIDEMPLWWPSTAWNCPPEVRAWCAQVRKRRITFVWTAQHQSHVANL